MNRQSNQSSRPGMGTIAIHGGHEANETHAHTIPIYQTSTYVFDSVAHGQAVWRGEQPGYIYTRLGNPNSRATAETIAALEGINLPERPFGVLTASGMAAVSTVLFGLARAGDTVVSQKALYGASYSILSQQAPHFGIRHATFNGPDINDLETVLAQHDSVRLVYIESPANPTMALTDIRGVVERAHAVGALVVADNTFATPYLQRPLEMGVDVVLHSTTKYLTGHGTVVGGAIVTANEQVFHENLLPTLRLHGATPSPMDAWLTRQGLKTFPLRMERHCKNGMAVARFLSDHPAVAHVNYPGLESFPQHNLARTQMDDFGAMLSFEMKGGLEAGKALMDHTRLCTLAVSLGTVDTLIEHPASMTHFKVAPEERAAMGITDGLVRLSVGLEDVEDILADLGQALAAVA